MLRFDQKDERIRILLVLCKFTYKVPASFTASESASLDFVGCVSFASGMLFLWGLFLSMLSIENGLVSIDRHPSSTK